MQIGRLLILLTTALLASCGFHLRGMVDGDSIGWLNNVAIIIQQAHRDLEPLLKEHLKAYHLQVNPDPAQANYWLILDNETMAQNITSISSSTTPRQSQIIYTVQFKLQQAKGVEMIPYTRIVVSRQVTLNSNRILGSNDEEEQQKDEMRRDAVIQILNHLSRFSPPALHDIHKIKRPHHAH